ncbi:uncharacterized protein B0H18DRAFT_966329, partial [Fomitopsis serialis]|uniref:uncharacterized protein n=1 Tax=Fomitopsis serialis TaxID=139415 RepID=UPI002008CA78
VCRNVHELCAMKYSDPSQFWEFIQSETALKCANSAQIDWVNSAPEGVLLLQDSVKATEELGIQ